MIEYAVNLAFMGAFPAVHPYNESSEERVNAIFAIFGSQPGLAFFSARLRSELDAIELLGDGRTVRYTPDAGFTGLTAFSFGAYEPANDIRIGPVHIAVLVTNVPNSPPILAAIPDATRFAGQTLTFTNTASDPDAAQTLSFTLLNAPDGASVGSVNGVFSWRPIMAQAGITNAFAVVATDNGQPPLSATQSFTVTVLRPAAPGLTQPGFSNGAFSLTISGIAGPDYTVLVSADLNTWTPVLTTNPPALPFELSDPLPPASTQRFYCIQLGP